MIKCSSPTSLLSFCARISIRNDNMQVDKFLAQLEAFITNNVSGSFLFYSNQFFLPHSSADHSTVFCYADSRQHSSELYPNLTNDQIQSIKCHQHHLAHRKLHPITLFIQLTNFSQKLIHTMKTQSARFSQTRSSINHSSFHHL